MTAQTVLSNGGNITLRSQDLLLLRHGSQISTTAGTAQAGGDGSNITINTDNLVAGPQFSGTVEINTPDVDPSQGLATLPAELVDVTGLIAQVCPAGVRQGQSKFIITGRGGLPPTPREALSTNAVLVDWVTLNPEIENRSSPAASTNQTRSVPAPTVEAQRWVIGANGEVVLTARAPTVTPHSFWQTPSCLAPQSAPGR